MEPSGVPLTPDVFSPVHCLHWFFPVFPEICKFPGGLSACCFFLFGVEVRADPALLLLASPWQVSCVSLSCFHSALTKSGFKRKPLTQKVELIWFVNTPLPFIPFNGIPCFISSCRIFHTVVSITRHPFSVFPGFVVLWWIVAVQLDFVFYLLHMSPNIYLSCNKWVTKGAGEEGQLRSKAVRSSARLEQAGSCLDRALNVRRVPGAVWGMGWVLGHTALVS